MCVHFNAYTAHHTVSFRLSRYLATSVYTIQDATNIFFGSHQQTVFRFMFSLFPFVLFYMPINAMYIRIKCKCICENVRWHSVLQHAKCSELLRKFGAKHVSFAFREEFFFLHIEIEISIFRPAHLHKIENLFTTLSMSPSFFMCVLFLYLTYV